MAAMENLIARLVQMLGIPGLVVELTSAQPRGRLELPGYYRPEKRWDVLIHVEERLIAAIELKAQVGPSFGNNANNRAEEAIGSAEDLWKAVREERFGPSPTTPFVGYVFLLEDCPAVHMPVSLREPHFPADAVFVQEAGDSRLRRTGVAYAKRYEVLLRRLRQERLYTAASLVLATRSEPSVIAQPASDLTFRGFVSALLGHVVGSAQ
jgi:hypothetical protein